MILPQISQLLATKVEQYSESDQSQRRTQEATGMRVNEKFRVLDRNKVNWMLFRYSSYGKQSLTMGKIKQAQFFPLHSELEEENRII